MTLGMSSHTHTHLHLSQLLLALMVLNLSVVVSVLLSPTVISWYEILKCLPIPLPPSKKPAVKNVVSVELSVEGWKGGRERKKDKEGKRVRGREGEREGGRIYVLLNSIGKFYTH